MALSAPKAYTTQHPWILIMMPAYEDPVANVLCLYALAAPCYF